MAEQSNAAEPSPMQLQAPEVVEIDSDGEEEEEHGPRCPICLASNYDNEKALIKGCYHAFCFFCILQWSEMTRSCPLCKTKFTEIVHDIDEAAQTFRLWKLDAPLSTHGRHQAARPSVATSGSKSSASQQQSFARMHAILRHKIYSQQLRPCKEFATQTVVPFGPAAAQAVSSSGTIKTAAALQQLRQRWIKKVDIWLRAELPVVLHHHVVDPTHNQHDEGAIEQEISMISSVVKGLLEQAGDLRSSGDAQTHIEKLLGPDTAIFIRDLMLFLLSPYTSIVDYDQNVPYSPTGKLEVDDLDNDAISVSSESDSDELNEVPDHISSDAVQIIDDAPSPKRRKTTEDPKDG